MYSDQYDSLVQCLMAELKKELPSLLTLNKIIKKTECPYMKGLAESAEIIKEK